MIARKAHKAKPYWSEAKQPDHELSKPFMTQERRLRERVSEASLAVTFKGATHTAANWSLGGFVIEGYRGSLTPGALFSIDAVGKPGSELTKVKVRARVVRANARKQVLAVSFLGLDSCAYDVLHKVMAERMRSLATDSCL